MSKARSLLGLTGSLPLLAGIAAFAADMPQDVSAFVSDRDQCDHFRGEEAYDAERQAELARKLGEFCAGTDARLASLKKKYAGRDDVMRRLGTYEETVE